MSSVFYGMTLIWVFVCFACALLCWISFIGALHGGRFVLHGPNLGISVGIGVLLCWVSFIGVLHRVRLCCMALIWVFVLCRCFLVLCPCGGFACCVRVCVVV